MPEPEYLITRASMTELLHDLSEDGRIFFKQEIKLVKAEMSEKVTKVGHDAMVLGIGNLMAGAGSVLLLISFGFLLSFAFQKTGLNTLLAAFLGFVIIGLVAALSGAALSVKGVKAISEDSLTPQLTINTITGGVAPPPGEPEPSAAELHRDVLATKERLGEEGHELGHRLAPARLKKLAIDHIRNHPVSWSTVAVACVLTGGYFIGRSLRRSEAFPRLKARFH